MRHAANGPVGGDGGTRVVHVGLRDNERELARRTWVGYRAVHHTWDWAPPDALPESDARLNNAFFKDHFQGAVEREFVVHSSQTVAEGDVPGSARPLSRQHLVEDQRQPRRPDRGRLLRRELQVRVFDDEVGTIIIDVVDGHTHRLLWRGWAQNPVQGVLNRPEAFRSRIQQAVARMFARFPKSI